MPPLRFAVEIVAWIATPIALWPASPVLAVLAVLVLIGLPTLFSTPGDKQQVIKAVPGIVTVLLVLLQLVAAAVAVWFAFPAWTAVIVWLLGAATVVTERRRWEWLIAH